MKRFYKSVSVGARDGGFAVLLDGRPVRTPAKNLLAVAERGIAEAVAGEWREQGEVVDPHAMRLNRLVNSAIDRVAGRRAEVVAEIARYAETDLVSYPAAGPDELARRQAESWEPLVAWIGRRHGIALRATTAIVPTGQQPGTADAVARIVDRFDDIAIAALHSVTAACGSVVIGLALADGEIDGIAAWEASLIEETFQIEEWGEDPEATRRRDGLRDDILAAETLLRLGRPPA